MLTMHYTQLGQLVRIMFILKRMGMIKTLRCFKYSPLHYPETGSMSKVWLESK